MEPREIAEKYVHGKHDALTDIQEVESMTSDINDYKDNMFKKFIFFIDNMGDYEHSRTSLKENVEKFLK